MIEDETMEGDLVERNMWCVLSVPLLQILTVMHDYTMRMGKVNRCIIDETMFDTKILLLY